MPEFKAPRYEVILLTKDGYGRTQIPVILHQVDDIKIGKKVAKARYMMVKYSQKIILSLKNHLRDFEIKKYPSKIRVVLVDIPHPKEDRKAKLFKSYGDKSLKAQGRMAFE